MAMIIFWAAALSLTLALAPMLGEYEPDLPNPAPCCTAPGCQG